MGINKKKEENKEKKKKQYPTYPKCSEFIPEILLLDTKTYRKIWKLQNVSLDEAIAQLSQLNDLKFKQSGRDNKKGAREIDGI